MATATRGPIPKRSAERRRRNKSAGETVLQRKESVTIPRLPGAKTPEGALIHPVARRWYNALKASAQSEFFEASDWAAAFFVVGAMSYTIANFTAASFTAVWSAMESLLTTEQARRRVRIEIERALDEPETGPTALDEYRKRLAK